MSSLLSIYTLLVSLQFSKRYLSKAKPTGLKGYLKDLDEYAKKIELGTHQGAPTRKEGEYNYTLYPHRDEFFECDLMDVYGRQASDVVEVNDGYVFLLLVINAQTKMVYFRPLRGKGGSEVAESLYDIFTNDIRPDTYAFHEILLHCDQGKEFYNAHVSKVTNKLGIHL